MKDTCSKVKAWNQIQFFTPEYIRTCDALAYEFKTFTISNIKPSNNKSFYCFYSQVIFNHWIQMNGMFFESKGLPLIYLNIISLLPKFDERRYIANSSDVAVIGISETKLDESFLQSEIQIINYDLLRRGRNPNDESVTCYIRSDISYIQKQYFPE